MPAGEKGVHETAVHGVLAGYELTDCQVTLLDGKHHPVDSSEMAFKLAAAQALKEAIHGSGGTLLEPVMTIRVFAPEAHAGDVVSDLNTKRAKIHGINPDGGMQAGCYVRDRGEVACSQCGFTPVAEASGVYALLPGPLLAGMRIFLAR